MVSAWNNGDVGDRETYISLFFRLIFSFTDILADAFEMTPMDGMNKTPLYEMPLTCIVCFWYRTSFINVLSALRGSQCRYEKNI